jgi:hypothetical protein
MSFPACQGGILGFFAFFRLLAAFFRQGEKEGKKSGRDEGLGYGML